VSLCSVEVGKVTGDEELPVRLNDKVLNSAVNGCPLHVETQIERPVGVQAGDLLRILTVICGKKSTDQDLPVREHIDGIDLSIRPEPTRVKSRVGTSVGIKSFQISPRDSSDLIKSAPDQDFSILLDSESVY